jgi:nucleoid DNA-binding protein
MNSLFCRQQLARKIARRTGIYKKDCIKMIDAFVDEMVLQLKSGEGVHIPKLGKFEYYVMRETFRYDRETGEKIISPPKTRVKFIPCKDVKYGVQLLNWKPYTSERQRKESSWYKKYYKD